MSHALHLRSRVRRIDLHIPPLSLRKLLMLMVEPFPILESLSFSPRVEDDLNLILPTTFLAPSLHYLTLLCVGLPKELPLLSFTALLVTLSLTDIRASGCFLPNYLASRLQALPHPEELSLSLSTPILPRLSVERELFIALETPVMFPTLQCLTFQSIWKAYALPLLEQLSVTLFNQVALTLPHISNSTNAIVELRFPDARVTFDHNAVSMSSSKSSSMVTNPLRNT